MDNLARVRLMDKMLLDLRQIIDSKTALLNSSSCIATEKLSPDHGAAVQKLSEFRENINKVIGNLKLTYNQLVAAKDNFIRERKLNGYMPAA